MRLGYRTCFHTLYDEKKKKKKNLIPSKRLNSSIRPNDETLTVIKNPGHNRRGGNDNGGEKRGKN